MFLAEIVAVNVDDKYLDQDGKLWLEKAGLIAYSHNYYYTLGRNVGFFGFSVCRSALKAREKMKNVVVEVKEPKIAKTEKDSKFTRKKWTPKPENPRGREGKFNGREKFERSRRMRFDDNENPAGTPRKPGRKFGFDKNSAPRKKFDDRFENGSSERQTGTGRHEGGFNRRPRHPMNKPRG